MAHRLLRVFSLLLLLAAASPANAGPPPGTETGFPWRAWSPAVFEQAKRENRFVLLSLQSWWCPWCHTMNVETYADPTVRAEIDAHFIPVRVDQDSRPDISIRYERWGWPATVIFGPDGTEIVKLRGFYSPKFFLPVLTETVRDPSPVDYGTRSGPERDATRQRRLTDAQRAEITAFMDKAWDEANGGWGKSKFVDGPSFAYALERARAGDAVMTARIRRTVGKLRGLIHAETGAMSQISTAPDWSKPTHEFPMFAQEAALRTFSQAYALWHDEADRAAAAHVFAFLRDRMAAPEGGFYSSLGLEKGEPGVDRSLYARETAQAMAGLVAYYEATGERPALDLALRAGAWALTARALPGGGFRHAERDEAGPYLGDTLAMGQAFLALYAATADRAWLGHAAKAADFILATFVDAKTGAFLTSAGTFPPPVKQREENVLAVRFLNLLASYTNEARYRMAAETGMGYLASPAVLGAFGFLPDVLLAEDELTHEPARITVVGAKADPAAAALFRAALAYPSAYKQVEWWDRREAPLASAKLVYPEYPQAAGFACTSTFCSLPVTAPGEVAEAIDRLERAVN